MTKKEEKIAIKKIDGKWILFENDNPKYKFVDKVNALQMKRIMERI
jgi:hypothetical protein